MKKTLLLIAAFAFSFAINAQICNPPCTPDPTCVDTENPGEVCPLVLPPATEGVYYDETVTVIPPASYQGLPVIHSIKITNVTGLPEGMSWCKSQDIFLVTTPATRYCCQLYGTSNQVGEYPLTLTIVPYINVFGVPVAQTAMTDDTSLTVIVLPYVAPPTAAFSADATTVESGANVTFQDESSNDPTAWAWTFEGGNPPASTDQYPVVNYPAEGIYDVTLTAYNAGGENSITMTDYITVVNTPSDIDDSFFANVKVYPNPATHEITVEAANLESVTIVDVLGKVVYSQNAKTEKEVIDISSLLKANYFIKVKTAEGEITKSITIR
jgi:hypothetical protein